MVRYFKRIWNSRNRNVYYELAFKFRVTPWRVYRLAHGCRASGKLDTRILEELFQRGIIVEIRSY